MKKPKTTNICQGMLKVIFHITSATHSMLHRFVNSEFQLLVSKLENKKKKLTLHLRYVFHAGLECSYENYANFHNLNAFLANTSFNTYI